MWDDILLHFSLVFHNNWWYWTPFHVLFGYLYTCGKTSIQIFCKFFKHFLLLSCMVTLYILDIIPYWICDFTNILPHVVGSVQSCSHVWLFVNQWTAARQASLSTTNFWSLPKSKSIASVMPSNHLILCCPILLLPSILSSIRVFSNESALYIGWPKYWSFSFNISPSNEHPGLISLGWTGWISLQSKGLSRVFSNTTVQKHQFFGAQSSS